MRSVTSEGYQTATLQKARGRSSGAPIMPCARASKKTTTGPFEPFFKSPNLNNNAVTRESIRKMRSANFVSKFLRGPTFGFVFCRDYCLFIFRFVFLYSRCFVGPGRAVEFSCCSFGLNSNLIKPVC